MHTVQLKLDTTKYDEAIIQKRFHMISHVHNVMVKHARKLINKLEADKEYQIYRSEYAELLKRPHLSKEDRLRKKELSRLMTDIRFSLGLSEYAFHSYAKITGAQFKKHLSSFQIQKEATRVWNSVRKYLFDNGKSVHFKKYRNFDTIGGKSNTNGVKFNKETLSIEWNGLNIACRLPRKEQDQAYVLSSLEGKISYCEIKRLMFPNGWHYYVVVVLKGNAPTKLEVNSERGTMGIDIGVSSVAAVSKDMVMLKELAPKCREYNLKIQKLLRAMDESKRKTNPDKYNEDGTINKKAKGKCVYSNNYFKKRNKLKSLYRQKSEYIRQTHARICNQLIINSRDFNIEKMSFRSLQKRAEKTERSDKASRIPQKDGSVKEVRKYKRKKRFGKTLNDRAPALFVNTLSRKAIQYGARVTEVNTSAFKASQYNHIDDTYIKVPLSIREKQIGENTVQRDLYSAFLLMNSNENYNSADRNKCIDSFDRFIEMHDALICSMKENNISFKHCFGF